MNNKVCQGKINFPPSVLIVLVITGSLQGVISISEDLQSRILVHRVFFHLHPTPHPHPPPHPTPQTIFCERGCQLLIVD